MRLLATIFLALFVGCAPSPRTLRLPHYASTRLPSVSPYPELKRQIDALLPDTLFPPSNAAIKIVSLSTGETLYDLNSELTLTPASNQKLFTSAAALSELGTDYQFTTRVFVDTASPPRIYIRGSGDPILSTFDLDSLAASLARGLPPGHVWTLAGDTSRFDDLPRGLGWTWDDEPDPTVMFISPLSLNGNTIRVLVSPGLGGGDSVRVTTNPATGYVSIENSATTNPDLQRSSLQISRKWREHSNTLTVTGQIPPSDSLASASLSVASPEWYTLTVFRERLESLGIRCAGLVLDSVPATARELAHRSHRLDSVLTFMNTTSDNLSAENVLKTLAAEKLGEPGSAAGGASIMRRFLATFEIDTNRVVIADGSGVSRYNLTSASAIIKLLTGMYEKRELFPVWYNSLPVAGVRGTISSHMKGTPAEGNLRAKTGNLAGVTSLSGYVTTADDETLAFSFLMQSFPDGARRYRSVQDRLGVFLATLRRGQL